VQGIKWTGIKNSHYLRKQILSMPSFHHSDHGISDVNRGQNLEAEARTMRPRPKPKIIMKKVLN